MHFAFRIRTFKVLVQARFSTHMSKRPPRHANTISNKEKPDILWIALWSFVVVGKTLPLSLTPPRFPDGAVGYTEGYVPQGLALPYG